MRLGVLDLGSNTTKILVVEAPPKGSFKVLLEKSLSARMELVPQDDGGCFLSPSSIEAVVDAVAALLASARERSVDHIIAIGTDALRQAKNQGLLIDKLGKLQIELSILSGEEEARYVSLGLLSDPLASKMDDLIGFDLGGGSLEVIEVRNRLPRSFHSLPLGAVRMKNRFGHHFDPMLDTQDFEEIDAYLSSTLSELPDSIKGSGYPIVGCGGALVFTRALLDSVGTQSEEACEITLADLIALLNRLKALTIGERCDQFPSLPADRADILPAGLAVGIGLLRFMKQDSLIHSYRNLRFGVAQEFFNPATA
jgi:exopolyphosphatase/guanosine-5'-triphosphate,3'-diphosphate pyrophosphatase